MLKLRLLALLLGVTALAACGDSGQTKTVTERTIIRETAPEAAEETPQADADETDAAKEDTGGSGSAGGKVRVPDVEGKDLQLAQDTMQSEGLYNLAEEDATGQGRLLLYDRNWTVVEQSPAPGSRVNEDATIILRAKKDGE